MASPPRTVTGATSTELREMIQHIREWEKVLGPLGGLGDWRPELRAYITEVAGQIRTNFNTHSAAGTPFDEVQPATARKRTNAAMRGTLAAMVDEGRAIPAAAALAHRPGSLRHTPLKQARGWRGLRDITSNTTAGNYPGLSAYRLAKLSATVGVRASSDAVPYARALLRSWRGRPARNYMRIPREAGRDYLAELVQQGVEARLEGWVDYRGSASGRRR